MVTYYVPYGYRLVRDPEISLDMMNGQDPSQSQAPLIFPSMQHMP